ncbi:MAG: hypothetical protein ACMXYF_04330 [Candidatus Woesearchaeota archaeon]
MLKKYENLLIINPRHSAPYRCMPPLAQQLKAIDRTVLSGLVSPRKGVEKKIQLFEYFLEHEDPITTTLFETQTKLFDIYELVRNAVKKNRWPNIGKNKFATDDAVLLLKRHVPNIPFDYQKPGATPIDALMTFSAGAGAYGFSTLLFDDPLIWGTAGFFAGATHGIHTIVTRNRSLFHDSAWDYANLEQANMEFYKNGAHACWELFTYKDVPRRKIKRLSTYKSISDSLSPYAMPAVHS